MVYKNYTYLVLSFRKDYIDYAIIQQAVFSKIVINYLAKNSTLKIL